MHGLTSAESCCELQTKATSVLEILCWLGELNCFSHSPVMFTKNSIKRLHSPTVDRACDGLLPRTIPSLKLLQRYCACIESEFTSERVFLFFFLNTRVCSSLLHLIYFKGGKKVELNWLDSPWLLPLFCFIIREPSTAASVLQWDVEHLSRSLHKQVEIVRQCKY